MTVASEAATGDGDKIDGVESESDADVCDSDESDGGASKVDAGDN